MTDRTNSLTVVLEKDHRVDNVEAIVSAIAMIKGVIDVEVNVADIQEFTSISRAKDDLGEKIIKVIYPEYYD